MTTTAFEMPEELRGIGNALVHYWERPNTPLFLVRGEVNSSQMFQTLNGFLAADHNFKNEHELLYVLDAGSSIVLATFTTIEEACEHVRIHQRTTSRFPFLSVRNLELSDARPLAEFLSKEFPTLSLMFDRPECYAEKYRHLLPEL